MCSLCGGRGPATHHHLLCQQSVSKKKYLPITHRPVVEIMTQTKGQRVCLICLKRFGERGASPLDADRKVIIPDFPTRFTLAGAEPADLCEGQASCLNGNPTKHKDGPSSSADIYSRFLHFSGRYLKMPASEPLLLSLAKQRKNATGKDIEAFCNQCHNLVGNICDLYVELQLVKLKLLWRVDELENVARQSDKQVSAKLARCLCKAVAKQLNMKRVRRVELFRKNIILRCHHKVNRGTPQVLIPRGLSSKQWIFPYSETKLVLMRLIVIFALTSISPCQFKKEKLPKGTKNRPVVAFEDTPHHSDDKSRPKRKVTVHCTFYDQVANDDDNPGHFPDTGGNDNDSDIDWSPEAPHATTSTTEILGYAACDDTNNDNTFNDKYKRLRRNTRVQRLDLGLVKVICSEEENDNEKTATTSEPSYLKSCVATTTASHCKMCNKSFPTGWRLKYHLKRVHKILLVYHCNMCGFKCKLPNQLKVHKRRAHFNAGPVLPSRKRISKNAPITTGGIPCPKCPNSKFANRGGLARHLISTHKCGLEHSCKKCNYKTTSKADLELHWARMHRKYKRIPTDKRKVQETKIKMLAPPGGKRPRGLSNWIKERINAMGNANTDTDRYANVPCQICQKTFDSGPSLRKHLDMEHEHGVAEHEKTVKCDLCQMKFALEQTCELHFFILHMRIYGFACDVPSCDAKFGSILELNKHLEAIHLEGGQGTQEESPNVSRTNVVLKQEISGEVSKFGDQVDVTPPQPQVKFISYCATCNWGFVNPDMLELHQLTHTLHLNDDPRREYPCPKFKCPVKNSSLIKTVGHYNIAHGKMLKAFKCFECPAIYCTSIGLYKHTRTHQNFPSKTLWKPREPSGFRKVETQCADCGRAWTNDCQLKNHQQVGRGGEGDETEYGKGGGVCGILGCQNTFTSSYKLFRHRQEHDPSNHLPCPEGCGAKFTNKKKLRVHLKRDHGQGGVQEQYPCSICGQSFNDPFNRRQHETFTHATDAKYECTICNKKYKRLGALRGHQQKSHNPDGLGNVLICAECGSVFKTAYGLKWHVDSVHTEQNEKRFACPHCPYRSHRSGLFRGHLKTCMSSKGIAYEEGDLDRLIGPPRKRGRKPDWEKGDKIGVKQLKIV